MKLNSYQQQFIDSREPFVGYFGGVGNGKTTIACMRILEHATQVPNNLCLVGRQTFPELRDSTREVFLGLLRQAYPQEAYQFNKAENSIVFPWCDNSTVIFRHLDNKESLLGPNLGAFYIDQAEQTDEEAFLTLQSRLRRPGTKCHQGLITGNPLGKNWIYERFGMDDANGGTNYSKNPSYRMITAPTVVNAANLPPEYINRLKESYSNEWFQRYVMGSWEIVEGQVFDLTKVKSYETLPRITRVFTGWDPAISKTEAACNTAFCTLGVGEDNHIYDLETVAGKWSFYESLEQAKRIVERHEVHYLGVESTGVQQAYFEAAQKYFPTIQVIDLKADRDKIRRAKAVSHIVSMGLFHTNNKELLAEMSAFTPDAPETQKKDRVDALVHALRMVQTYAPTHIAPPANKFEGKSPFQAYIIKSEELAQEKLKQGPETIHSFSPDQLSVEPGYF